MDEETHYYWAKRLFVTKAFLFEWTQKPDIIKYLKPATINIYYFHWHSSISQTNFPNNTTFVGRSPGLLSLCFCSENLWRWSRLWKTAGIIVTRADGSTPRNILSPSHLVHHKYQVNWSGFEPGTQRWVNWYCGSNGMKMDGCNSSKIYVKYESL